LKADRGDISAALAHFRSAARTAASETGEKWLAAQTAHDLFVLLADVGEIAAAESEAVKALAWYPKHHARFPLAVHDYAMVLVRQARYGAALQLLEQVRVASIPAVDEVIVWSTYARVLGGLGELDRFRAAEEKLTNIIPVYPHHGSAALINLGFGCYYLGLWETAELYAKEGISRARTASSPEAIVGSSLLKMVQTRELPPPVVRTIVNRESSELLDGILQKLVAWRGPTWRRKHQADPKPILF
jgi:tetratricopeptide (TPR) repeat protein